MSDSLLSFIVPVYDPELGLLEKAVKSLVEQSLKKWEAVFVLDGPNDEAREVVEKAMKKSPNRYKVIEVPHGGAQKARNAGFPESSGNYVVFWDCDCVIEPHSAKAWVDMLDKHPEYGFIYSGYKFLGERGAINSEAFDPYLLRVRNYISSCFPLRRELFPGWDESLESLQDWSFWLSVVERGGVGKMLQGYAFSTAYPTPKSISGKGCSPQNWLERMDKVKALHNIPIREVCVTSIHDKLDGIALAKALDADYQDYPSDKPNHYKTIIQLGFSVQPGEFERCASAWDKQHKKVIFWTAENVEGIYDGVSLRAIEQYAARINLVAKQYVEDKAAEAIMTRAGFKVEVLPLPISAGSSEPFPDEPKFLVDISPNYGHAFNAIQRSLPDIKLELAQGAQEIKDYMGLVCFHQDRLMRPSVKRMLAAGRHVISNIQSPFAGCVDDRTSDAQFIKEFVGAIRAAAKSKDTKDSAAWYADPANIRAVAEAIA